MREYQETDFIDYNHGDWLDIIKSNVKKYPRLYHVMVNITSPVLSRISLYRKKISYFNIENQEAIVLNIGSGTTRLATDHINFDYYPYESVDIVGDVYQLPFCDNYADTIINFTLLEHIENPNQAIKEMYRVLKPGGFIFTVVPFIQGFHASPYDYCRWTSRGIDILHSDFDKLESGVFGGPTSGMLWILQEWIAMVLSLGIIPLYKIWFILILLLTWPIKLLDYILEKHPMASNVASNFYYLGCKSNKIE